MAVWAVGNHVLKLTWSACFDGFLSLCEGAAMKHADMCVSALFSFLGWGLSEDKLVSFDSGCKVLYRNLAGLGGCQNGVGSGFEILKSRRFSKKDGDRLRGRLQFANIHLFGCNMLRSPKNLNKRVAHGRKGFCLRP